MRPLVALSTLAALLSALSWAFVDGAIAQQQETQGRESQANFAQEFWDFLKKADYKKEWQRWPGAEEFREGQAPHGAFLRLYINDEMVNNLDDPPQGSIIIKENYGEDKEKLLALTIMYKTKDFDPEHGNWWWVKYNADGTVAKAQDMPIAGKVQSCISCHSNAEGDDYIFTNDEE